MSAARRVFRAAVATTGLLLACLPAAQPPASAHSQATGARSRGAGLEWRFVRIKYHYLPQEGLGAQDFTGEPWYIDAPAAEQNLSRRLRTATAIQVEDPIVLSLDDPRLFEHPWIYIVEPGTLSLRDTEVKNLREFLLRGGTATFDDFHGPLEWENLARELRRVFPDRRIVEVPPEHPVFSCFYTIKSYPQVPGLGSFLAGRTWEKGGVAAHLRTILDDAGRPMLFINWNTDMGDGWEWSNAEDYPDYLFYTAIAYRMGINEVVYALTH